MRPRRFGYRLFIMVLGLAASAWLWSLVGWQVFLAIFIFTWINNLSQKEVS